LLWGPGPRGSPGAHGEAPRLAGHGDDGGVSGRVLWRAKGGRIPHRSRATTCARGCPALQEAYPLRGRRWSPP
jgi:hypothetical protein